MAQVQEYFEPTGLYTSPPLPRSQFLYDLSTSAAVCPGVSMAQPVLQSSFKPARPMSQSQWPMPQSSISSNVSAHIQLWGQCPASTDSTPWTELPNEPLTDESMLANGDLLYSYHAGQSTLEKLTEFDRPSFWTSGGMSNMAPSPKADIILSPVSPFSDTKNTYSPGPEYSPASPGHGSERCTMQAGVTKVSSTSSVPSMSQVVIRQQSGSSAIQSNFRIPFSSVEPPYADNTFKQNVGVTMYGSEEPYGQPQSSSPGVAQWLPPGYVVADAALAQGFQQQHTSTPQINHSPDSFLASLNRTQIQRQAQWSNTAEVPEQSHFQTRFMTPVADSEKAQRARDDETLLRMKQDGYTYKDIRKALDRKVAESTLRGRYRSLIKPRKDRLRAPKWTEIDIILLKRYVQEEFDKLDVVQPSLEAKQKPDKVPWMKVVELIASTGGTYRFGAATAKKKWSEVTHPASTWPSRGRSQV